MNTRHSREQHQRVLRVKSSETDQDHHSDTAYQRQQLQWI